MTTTINHRDRARHHAGAMDDTAPPDPEVPERSSGRRQFSAKYKAKILAEYDTLPRSARGAMLRREGLYSSLIVTWRRQRDQGAHAALARPAGRQKADPRDREIVRLKQGGRPTGQRARQVQTGRRDPEKTFRAVGATRHGQHSGERRAEMIDEAIGQLTPIVGTTAALASRGGGPGHLVSPASPEPGPAATRTGRHPSAPGPQRGRAQGDQERPSSPTSSSTRHRPRVYAKLLDQGTYLGIGLHHVPGPARARRGA